MDTTSPDQLSERDRRRLDDLHVRLQREARRFVGYPCTALFDYSPLYRFLAFPANNIGDPYPMFGVTRRNSLRGKGRIFD